MRIVTTLIAGALLVVLSFIAYDLHRIATVIYSPYAHELALSKLSRADRVKIEQRELDEDTAFFTAGLNPASAAKRQPDKSATK